MVKNIPTNKQNFILLLDALGFPAIHALANGIIKHANNRAIDILQLDPKHYIGNNLNEHCRKKCFSLNSFFDLKNAPLDNLIKETYLLKNKISHTLLWKKISFSNLFEDNLDDDMLIIGQDITPEQTAIDNFKETVFFYENILSKLPTNVYWKDKNCVYLGCNDRLAHIMKLPSRDAIKGMTDFDFDWGSNAAESFIAFDKKVMKTGKSLTTEDVFKEADGNIVTVITNKTPLKNKKGEIIGVLAISVDITERKKIEKALEKAKGEVESANYIMTELIANLGHDLATPISDLGSIAQMLSIYADEYPELKELIEELVKRCEDCVNIRQEFIDATSISKLEVKLERFSISVELLKLEKEFRALISSKNLKFTICPLKPFKEVFIETDRKKFSAILRELISNAIQFTANAGEISISILKSDGYFIIEVTDTGIGIPSDKFEFIFKQYTKLSRSNKYGVAFKGVGAGLYLVTILVNILGGTISVKSKVGKGSTFTFSIPEYFPKT